MYTVYMIYLPSHTARTPDVQVTVDTRVTHASAYEGQGSSYSVGIGQEFALACTTSSFFEVYWYHGDVLGESIHSITVSLIALIWLRTYGKIINGLVI